MIRTAALALIALMAAASGAAAQMRPPAYPILADDGRPALNHRVTPEQAKAVEALPGVVVVGNPKGDVTLSEFYDLNCTYCRRASADIDRLLQEDPKLRVVLVPYPVLGVQSILASRVELAVRQLVSAPQFYEFHRRVYEGRGTIDGNRAAAAAKPFNLDQTKLVEIANDDATTEIMKAHVRLGDVLKLAATPSYVVGDVAILGHPGAGALKTIVASMRQCGKPAC